MPFLHFLFDLSHLLVIVSFYLWVFFVISRIISCQCFTHSFVHYRFEIQQSLNPTPRQSIKSSVKQEEGFCSLVFRNSAVSNGHSSKITKSKSTEETALTVNSAILNILVNLQPYIEWTMYNPKRKILSMDNKRKLLFVSDKTNFTSQFLLRLVWWTKTKLTIWQFKLCITQWTMSYVEIVV